MKNYKKIRRIQKFIDSKIVIGNLSLYGTQLDVPDNLGAKLHLALTEIIVASGLVLIEP